MVPCGGIRVGLRDVIKELKGEAVASAEALQPWAQIQPIRAAESRRDANGREVRVVCDAPSGTSANVAGAPSHSARTQRC